MFWSIPFMWGCCFSMGASEAVYKSAEALLNALVVREGEVVCFRCGRAYGTVEVHGHVQTTCCGQNIDPCCGGAPSNVKQQGR
jgi:hypothetical protein